MQRDWKKSTLYGLLLAILVLLALLVGPRLRGHHELQTRTTTRLIMGTLVSITTWHEEEGRETQAVVRAFEEMQRLEALAGRRLDTSPVWKINHAPWGEKTPIPQELFALLQKGLSFQNLSQGAFDISLAPLIDLWGFNSERTPHLPEMAKIQTWREHRAQALFSGVLLEEEKNLFTVALENDAFGLDLGAIAKGYALDQAMKVLKNEGIANAIINAGGDLVFTGSKGKTPWRIGIQHPRETDKVMAVSEISQEMAMVTSGDYERYFMVGSQRYHHIMDSKTGEPSRSGLISVSIQATDATTADALSTAIFVMGMEKGKRLILDLPKVEGLLVNQENEHWKSPGFIGQWQ